jgi:hypothetical protein
LRNDPLKSSERVKKILHPFVFVVFFLARVGVVYAQTSPLSGLKADGQIGGYFSSYEKAPFWLRTNQFGAVPSASPAGIIQASARRGYVFFDSTANKARKFDWSAAVNPLVTYAKAEQFKVILPEAYASVRFKNVELYLGRRREVMGLGDTTLSSGFYAGSGNALPIPKIQIGTVGFTPLKFTRNFVAIHAAFAHGWFGTNYLDGVRLHQKFLYFRLGKPQKPVKLIFGLNHNVMWAGHAEYLKDQPDLAQNGSLPSSWKFFPNVVFAYTSKKWYNQAGYGAFDSYRLGNHLGSYDVAVEAKVRGQELLIYHQHPFEDVSSMVFQNIPDGLYGISLKPSASAGSFALIKLTIEFLTTKDQSGSEFYIQGSRYQGADNYFNHSQYTQGWSSWGRTIGTPFIIPAQDMDQSRLINPRYFPNNRVNVWYLGAQGRAGRALLFTLRGSYSRNYGTPGANFDPVRGQFSGLLSGEYKFPFMKNTSAMLSLAMDRGTVFNNNSGGYLGLKKWL